MRLQIECEAPEACTVTAVIARLKTGGIAQLAIISIRPLVFPPPPTPVRRYTPQQWEAMGLCVTDQGQSCGCDPVADCMCERHQTELGL